jgi:tetratricopeptide (TPR) repeat protein
VQKRPRDPKGYRDLATAYEAKGDTDLAIGALQSYTGFRTKDAKAFAELGGLQLTTAQSLLTQYENARANEALAAPSLAIFPSGTSPVGKALGANPVEQAASTQVNAVVTDLAQRTQLAYSDAVASYRRMADLEPNNANAQFQLAQAAQTAGDTATAVAGYKRYLKLIPNGSTAGQVRALIKQLTGK